MLSIIFFCTTSCDFFSIKSNPSKPDTSFFKYITDYCSSNYYLIIVTFYRTFVFLVAKTALLTTNNRHRTREKLSLESVFKIKVSMNEEIPKIAMAGIKEIATIILFCWRTQENSL
mmetsp:Transcript_16281/g.18783  ORF Transcript_16281/g.18783 Transcript_16281/m.18783 type:complete len:116 (+) Transcript_16281:172-519(+)